MRSFAREVKEKDFTSIPRAVSRYIYGYKAQHGVRYIVNVRGVYGGVFLTFDEADTERRKIINDLF